MQHILRVDEAISPWERKEEELRQSQETIREIAVGMNKEIGFH